MSESTFVAILKSLEAEAEACSAQRVKFDSWTQVRAAQARGPGFGRDHSRAGEWSIYDLDTHSCFSERRDR